LGKSVWQVLYSNSKKRKSYAGIFVLADLLFAAKLISSYPICPVLLKIINPIHIPVDIHYRRKYDLLQKRLINYTRSKEAIPILATLIRRH
jgi:hypothetical protein